MKIADRLASLASEIGALRKEMTQNGRSASSHLRDLKLRALAELAAGAGHEINNPLAVISGQAQCLLRTEENLDRARALERIIFQSQRIHQILRDLMFFARPPRPKRERLDLRRILRSSADSLTDLALERRVALRQPVAGKRVPFVGDRNLLETAVTALLRNAIQAAPVGGWADLSLRTRASQRIDIVVQDNGPGLNPSQSEHLFDPFYSFRPAGRGLGLGLPKVWRIAELHGGSIQFDCPPGRPTRFVFSLPAAGIRQKPAKPHRRQPAENGHVNGEFPGVRFVGARR